METTKHCPCYPRGSSLQRETEGRVLSYIQSWKGREGFTEELWAPQAVHASTLLERGWWGREGAFGGDVTGASSWKSRRSWPDTWWGRVVRGWAWEDSPWGQRQNPLRCPLGDSKGWIMGDGSWSSVWQLGGPGSRPAPPWIVNCKSVHLSRPQFLLKIKVGLKLYRLSLVTLSCPNLFISNTLWLCENQVVFSGGKSETYCYFIFSSVTWWWSAARPLLKLIHGFLVPLGL